MPALLEVSNLSVEYTRQAQPVRALRGVSFQIQPGESVGILGESGCGKSTLALSLMRLLPERESRFISGRIVFDGRDVLTLSPENLRQMRGRRMGFVSQDPFSALNPVLTVEDQIDEVFQCHGLPGGPGQVRDILSHVRIGDPDRVARSYPHQISGGQRQRVCLAMAVAGNPQLLIADEPTTSLDVTVQKEILDLLDQLKKDMGMAILFITHNVALLTERTQTLMVMYAGQIAEWGPTARVLKTPAHPYTQALLKSLPRIHKKAGRLPTLPGHPPSLTVIENKCPFAPRCPKVFGKCLKEDPALRSADGREVACHLY